MTYVSSSPQRHTFQDKNPDYADMWEAIRKAEAEKIHDPEWQKDNLEFDLRSTEWVLEKARSSNVYAQHLYAALCNNEFTRREMWPILTEQKWSCSWRHAGGIISDMLQTGDYIDWYCSGINGPEVLSPEELSEMTFEQQEHYREMQASVREGFITDEIEHDLHTLGWIVTTSEER